MKNSLSVVDKQIKENRSKIALTTSATEEEEERRAKPQGRKQKSERAPVPEANTREGREDRDRTF
jgi:hypothetical protein